jgi:hypothetical protein
MKMLPSGQTPVTLVAAAGSGSASADPSISELLSDRNREIEQPVIGSIPPS